MEVSAPRNSRSSRFVAARARFRALARRANSRGVQPRGSQSRSRAMPSTSPHRGRHPRISGGSSRLALAALPALTGCTTASYLVQAGFGQLDLLEARRDIDEVVRDRRTSPRLRALLGRVEEIKRFGEKQGLTPTSNYSTYADLDRPVAVWVVTAAEPSRFRNRTWSFPIVGSVPYLGFFDRDDARGLARDLRAAGWDVDLRGASAYSTLGWFADPVLSTMIGGGDEALGELADVVLHESFHATHYVKGQSLFDESAADFVGDHLAEAYPRSGDGAGVSREEGLHRRPGRARGARPEDARGLREARGALRAGDPPRREARREGPDPRGARPRHPRAPPDHQRHARPVRHLRRRPRRAHRPARGLRGSFPASSAPSAASAPPRSTSRSSAISARCSPPHARAGCPQAKR